MSDSYRVLELSFMVLSLVLAASSSEATSPLFRLPGEGEASFSLTAGDLLTFLGGLPALELRIS